MNDTSHDLFHICTGTVRFLVKVEIRIQLNSVAPESRSEMIVFGSEILEHIILVLDQGKSFGSNWIRIPDAQYSLEVDFDSRKNKPINFDCLFKSVRSSCEAPKTLPVSVTKKVFYLNLYK